MRLLLDTHIVLWSLLDSPVLGEEARSMIGADGNDIFVSAVSIWEIAIKRALTRPGREPMRLSASDALDLVDAAGFSLLPVSGAHAAVVERLPAIHGDPFDRLLVAQAIHEPMRLLTRDAVLARYGEPVALV